MIIGICIPFIKEFVSVNTGIKETITVTVSATNPKKKGYKVIKRNRDNRVMIRDEEFAVCYSEEKQLDNLGIKLGDSFWMKVEKIG